MERSLLLACLLKYTSQGLNKYLLFAVQNHTNHDNIIHSDHHRWKRDKSWAKMETYSGFIHFHLKIQNTCFSLVYISCSVQNTVVTILFFLETFSGRRRRLWTDGRGQGKLVWSQATLRFNSSLGFCNWICTKKINLWTYIFLSSSLCKKLFPCLVVWK